MQLYIWVIGGDTLFRLRLKPKNYSEMPKVRDNSEETGILPGGMAYFNVAHKLLSVVLTKCVVDETGHHVGAPGLFQ